jgi:hypothetical protein
MRTLLGICLLFAAPALARAQDELVVPPIPADDAAERERLREWLLERLRAAEGFQPQAYEKAKADLQTLSLPQLERLVQAFRDRERQNVRGDETQASEALRRAYSDLESATALRDHLRRRLAQKQSEMPPPVVPFQFGVPFGAYGHPYAHSYPYLGYPFQYGPANPPFPPETYWPPLGYPYFPY